MARFSALSDAPAEVARPSRFSALSDNAADFVRPSRFSALSDNAANFVRTSHFSALSDAPADFVRPSRLSALSDAPADFVIYVIPLLRLDQTRIPLISVLRAADMNTTADQVINLSPKRYIVRRVIITNASTSLTTAVGGIYTGTGKTGVALVPAGQSYAALTGSNKFIDATLHASTSTDHYVVTTLYLSLTTPQGVPATADIYIYGDSVEA